MYYWFPFLLLFPKWVHLVSTLWALLYLLYTDTVVGVMKMGNIVLRAGIEPISLACRDSVLTPPMLRNVTVQPMPTCLCGSLP